VCWTSYVTCTFKAHVSFRRDNFRGTSSEPRYPLRESSILLWRMATGRRDPGRGAAASAPGLPASLHAGFFDSVEHKWEFLNAGPATGGAPMVPIPVPHHPSLNALKKTSSPKSKLIRRRFTIAGRPATIPNNSLGPPIRIVTVLFPGCPADISANQFFGGSRRGRKWSTKPTRALPAGGVPPEVIGAAGHERLLRHS